MRLMLTSILVAAIFMPILARAQDIVSAVGSPVSLGGVPCTRIDAARSSAEDGTMPFDLDHEVAVYVVKHLQRACRGLGDLARSAQATQGGESVKARLDGVTERLHAEILVPIYRRHPDLRGQDLTGEGPGRIEQGAGPGEVRRFGLVLRPGQLERESAMRLEHALSEASATVAALGTAWPKDSDPADRERTTHATIDVVAELNFATNPVYASFPDLWDEKFRAAEPQDVSRTADSDAFFRKAAPEPGAVRLSPAIVSRVREALTELERMSESKTYVMALIWTSGMSAKGPDDGAWKSTGPTLVMGSYDVRLIPPDVIRVIEGVSLVFLSDGTVRFDGKLIDYRDGKLVLVDP